MSPRGVLVALTSVVALLALAGCGLEGQPFDTGDSTSGTPELGDAVVTPETISEYPPSSPETAALRWWRALQTRDSKAAINSYTPEVRDELPNDFARILVAFLAPSASQASIAIDYVESASEDETTVYAVVDGAPDSRMNGPLALPMAKDDDKWLITDATFIEALAKTFRVGGETGPSDATADQTTSTESGE